MKRTAQTHRIAGAALFAAALASSNLVLAQEAPPPTADPLSTERPVTLPPSTAPTVTTPPASTQPAPSQPVVPAPLPKATVAPEPAAETARPAATRSAATRRTTSATSRTRSRATAPAAERTPATAPVEAAAAPPAAAGAPPPATAAPPPAEALPALPAEPPAERGALWLIGAGVLALLAALAAFALIRRRRRARDEIHGEPVYEQPAEPVIAEQPAVEPVPAAAFAPAAAAIALSGRTEPAIEPARVSVADADPADAEAVAAGSEPAAGRPWLEFFLRPVRAGIDEEAATVEFDLIVGNTGSEPARDVRVSAFMFPAGSAAESEMERMLIEPPSGDAAELALDPGGAARVEGAARLPRQALAGDVLPVVLADARYRLPDGSEGRMRAAFEVGRAEGEAPAPFRADPPAGVTGEVATRLHGEVERV